MQEVQCDVKFYMVVEDASIMMMIFHTQRGKLDFVLNHTSLFILAYGNNDGVGLCNQMCDLKIFHAFKRYNEHKMVLIQNEECMEREGMNNWV